jgi:hypothetical protein
MMTGLPQSSGILSLPYQNKRVPEIPSWLPTLHNVGQAHLLGAVQLDEAMLSQVGWLAFLVLGHFAFITSVSAAASLLVTTGPSS